MLTDDRRLTTGNDTAMPTYFDPSTLNKQQKQRKCIRNRK